METFRYIENQRELIVGVGSALVDILIHEQDEFLKKTNAAKGGMTLVDKGFIERAITLSSNTPSIVPGGSACNTVVGVSKLGGKARFVGKCGKDDLGYLIENDLKEKNVQPTIFRSEIPTGRVLSIITPDAQRSMFTYLGASAEAHPKEITNDCFVDAAIVHVEGYLLFNPELIKAALAAAKAVGAKVSLDLASYTVVESSKELLQSLVETYVDILIANEEEALAFTGAKDETRALHTLAEMSETAVLKVGARGSYIAYAGEIVSIGALGDGDVLDTTGAGDLWAAGFLFGLVKGFPLLKCGRLGSACGYEVCQIVGANIPDVGWQRIKKLIS